MGAFRRGLRRLIRFFVLRPAALLGVGAVVLAVLAAGLLLPFVAQDAGVSASLPLPRPPQGEPNATEEFLRANRDANADLMWESLSEEARERFRSQGGSPEALQRQMDLSRGRGARLEEFWYIGGKSLPDGTSYQFYLTSVRQPSQPNAEYVPFTFTLDRSGKIAKIQ